MSKYEIGKTYYFHSDDGSFISGEVTRTTNLFCYLKCENGNEKRKSKRLLYESVNEVKLLVLQRANDCVIENYKMNIMELGSLFQEMIKKYPEKFI